MIWFFLAALLAACSSGGSGSTPTAPAGITGQTPVGSQSTPSLSPLLSTQIGASSLQTPLGGTIAPRTPVSSSGGTQAGEQLYAANCASCHQANGQGVQGSIPALVGNPNVIGAPGTLIQKVLSVKSSSHNFKDRLSDEDLAVVLTFIRSSWGNHANPVTPGQVKSVR